MSRPQVLVVTCSRDGIGAVLDAIRDAGAEPVRLDTDRIGAGVSITIDQSGPGTQLEITTPEGGRLALDRLGAIWYRRNFIGEGLPATLCEPDRDNAFAESSHALEGLVAAAGVFVMDPVAVLRQAGHKPLQLRLAAELGLATPRTLHTNIAAAARDFVGAEPGEFITKVLTAFSVLEEGREVVVFTNVLRPEDLEDLDGLRLAPCTFQERIEKQLELRVTIVGKEVFANAIDSRAEPGAEVDWRRRGLELATRWRPYELPSTTREQLVELVARLGLHYGAADVILAPDGRYVVLEVNPAGEFLDQDAIRKGAICRAIATLLVDRARRHLDSRATVA